MYEIGIESYSYHRYFGELRAGEIPVDTTINMIDFLTIAESFEINSIGIQTCFIDFSDTDLVKKLSSKLQKKNYCLVISWGHPSGLELGTNTDAFTDLLEKLRWAQSIDADHLRVVIDSPKYWNFESSKETINRVIPMLYELETIARKDRCNISIENHGGLRMETYHEILQNIDSKSFGMTFDIGNFIRTGEKIEDALKLLGRYIKVVHIKDFLLDGLNPGSPDGWWPTVALGEGDLPLKDTLSSLHKLNYTGPLLVELMAPFNIGESENETIKKSLSFLIEQQTHHQLE